MPPKPVPLDQLDKVVGGAGFQQGTAHSDYLTGSAGQDFILGGAGNDVISGGAGSDQLYGDAGNDVLDGGAGDRAADLAFGGDGNDSFVWAPGDGNDQFYGGNGTDTLRLPTMTAQQLQQSLHLDTSSVQMRVSPSGQVTFSDASGSPASVSGTITVGGETLRFGEVEAMQVKG